MGRKIVWSILWWQTRKHVFPCRTPLCECCKSQLHLHNWTLLQGTVLLHGPCIKRLVTFKIRHEMQMLNLWIRGYKYHQEYITSHGRNYLAQLELLSIPLVFCFSLRQSVWLANPDQMYEVWRVQGQTFALCSPALESHFPFILNVLLFVTPTCKEGNTSLVICTEHLARDKQLIINTLLWGLRTQFY